VTFYDFFGTSFPKNVKSHVFKSEKRKIVNMYYRTLLVARNRDRGGSLIDVHLPTVRRHPLSGSAHTPCLHFSVHSHC